MGGEHGGAGYAFQYWTILQIALDRWGEGGGEDTAALLIEGEPGQDSVDCTTVTADGRREVLTQIRSRVSGRPLSARDVVNALVAMEEFAVADRSRLEFITNGRLGPSALTLVETLARTDLRDQELADVLCREGLSDLASSQVCAALRASEVVARPVAIAELRTSVTRGLLRLRTRSGCPVGWRGAALVRAAVYERLWSKIDSPQSQRKLTREEFLGLALQSRKDLEAGLWSRWGVPVGFADREQAVRRDRLLDAIAVQVQDSAGEHAADGVVRRCVLAGQAGAGKTTLAQQYALEHAAEFDWVYQVTVQESGDVAASEPMVGRAFDRLLSWLRRRDAVVDTGPFQHDGDRARAVQEALGSWPHRWLIIVDNAIDPALVTPYLPATGYGVVLATTRDSGWPDARATVVVGVMTTAEATELVHSRLDGTGLHLDGDAVAELIDRLSFFPLGLATAAAYLSRTRQPLERFLEALEQETLLVDALGNPRARPVDYPLPVAAAIRLAVRHVEGRVDRDSACADALGLVRRASLLWAQQIPPFLLQRDPVRFANGVAVLMELSLMHRWQDVDQLDWVGVHRLVQDVVRVDLSADTETRDDLLSDVQSELIELTAHCAETRSSELFSLLRTHGDVVAAHVENYGLSTWSNTTALLANTAALAMAMGDAGDAEHLFERALALVPEPAGDWKVEIRRTKTLLAYGGLLNSLGRYDEAAVRLRQARDISGEHRSFDVHADVLSQARLLLLQNRAMTTLDEDELLRLYEDAALYTGTDEALRLSLQVRAVIASKLDWRVGADR